MTSAAVEQVLHDRIRGSRVQVTYCILAMGLALVTICILLFVSRPAGYTLKQLYTYRALGTTFFTALFGLPYTKIFPQMDNISLARALLTTLAEAKDESDFESRRKWIESIHKGTQQKKAEQKP